MSKKLTLVGLSLSVTALMASVALLAGAGHLTSAATVGKFLRSSLLNPASPSSPLRRIAQEMGLRPGGPQPAEWNVVGHMVVPRSGAAVAKLPDGRILIAGGEITDGYASTVELFDPVTRQSHLIDAQMSVARAYAGVTVLPNGKVLFTGGENADGQLEGAEIFDPVSNTFRLVAGKMVNARSHHTATLLPGGSVLIAGGAGVDGVLDTTENFDVANESFTLRDHLTSKRSGHSATLLPDGSLIIAGGNDGEKDLDTAEIGDTNRITFAPANTKLPAKRAGAAAEYLDDNGAVMFAGGSVDGTVSDQADLFNPDLNSFRGTARLQQHRTTPGSALVTQSQAMIFGGRDESGRVLDTIENYFFSTLRTDKKSYKSGDTVKVTGSGWMPGEVVTLSVPGTKKSKVVLTAIADDLGNIVSDEFVVDADGATVRSYKLHAKGEASGQTAQAAFRGTGPHASGDTYFSRVGVGNWNTAATWSKNAADGTGAQEVPTADSIVKIQNGAVIILDTSYAIAGALRTLDVGSTGGGTLLIGNDNNARTLSVTGLVTVGSGGGPASTLAVSSSSNTTHTVNFGGGITNNGVINLASDADSLANSVFGFAGTQQNQTVLGNSISFNRITLDNGAGNTLNVNSVITMEVSAAASTLTLTTGTFVVNNSATTITPFGGNFMLGANAGYTVQAGTSNWGNAGSLTLNAATARLATSGGTMNAGNATAANTDGRLILTAGTVTVSSGTLNVAGGIDANNAAGTFNATGGTVNVGTDGGFDTGSPLLATAGAFTLNNGTLNVQRPGNAKLDIDAGKTFTGSTVTFGPAGGTYILDSASSLNNMAINTTGTVQLNTSALTIAGNFTITQGTYDPNNINLSVGGNWTNDSNQTLGTATVTFNGSAPQTIGGAATTTVFNNLTINNSGSTVTVTKALGAASNGAAVAGDLNIAGGTFNMQTNAVNRTAAGGIVTVANGATLRTAVTSGAGGVNAFPQNFMDRIVGITSTVSYEGAAAQIIAQPMGNQYGFLSLSGAGTKTAAGTLIVAETFTNASASTYDGAAATLTLNGGTASATNANNGRIQNVTTLTLGNAAADVFTNTSTLSMNAADVVVFGALTNTGNITATNSLTVKTGGGLTHTSETISVSGAGTTVENGATINNNSTYTNTAGVNTSVTSTGSISNGGSYTTKDLTGTGAFTQNNGSTLNASGAVTITTLNASTATNTVSYTGAGQTVKSPTPVSGTPTYSNLTLSGSGTVTLPGPLATNNFTIDGTVSTTAAATMTIGGNLIVTSNAVYSAASFTHTISGNVTSNGLFNGSSATINAAGNWTGTGSFGIGTSSVNLNSGNGVNQTLSGTAATIFNNLTLSLASGAKNVTAAGVTMTLGGNFSNATGITFTPDTLNINGAGPHSNSGTTTTGTLSVNAGTLTNNGTITSTNTLSGAGTLTQGAAGTLNFGGSSITLTTLTASAAGNTVNYNGTGQTVRPITYSNLTLSGSGTKDITGVSAINSNFSLSGTASATAATAMTIGNNFTIGAGTTFSGGSFTHNLAGNWSNSGTFNAGTSTLNMNGAGAQSMSGSTFNNLIINNPGNTVTFFTDETVDNDLTITAGTLDMNGKNLTVNGGDINVTGTLTTGVAGTVTLSGAGNLGGAGTTVMNNLTLSGAAATTTLAGNITANGVLTIGAGRTLDASNKTMNLNGTGTPFVITGTFTPGTSTVSYNPSSGTAAITAATYNNLTVAGANLLTVAGAVTVNGSLNVTNTNASGLTITDSASAFIDLGTTGSLMEPNSNITGQIRATRTIADGGNSSFGGIGVIITDVAGGSSPGATTVRRYSKTAGTPAGETAAALANSVSRFWSIFATNSTGQNATISFGFYANELGALTASNLIANRFDGTNWLPQLTPAANRGNPTVTGNITTFSPWKLANAVATKAVVVLPGQVLTEGTGVTGTATDRTAGAAFNVDVKALDAANNLASTATGAVGVTTSDPNDTEPAAGNFVNGSATFSITNKTAGAGNTITPTGTGLTNTTSSSYNVLAGAFSKLQLLVPGETAAPGTATGETGTPTAQTAGTAFNVTVNAVDANFNFVNTGTDTVGITSSDANAVLPANAALMAGTKSFSVTLKSAGSRTVTATDITDGTKTASTSPSIPVNAGAFAKLLVLLPGETAAPGTTSGRTGTPSAQVSGTPFNITVNAVDANNNFVNTPTDTVGITSTDSNATLPANAALIAGTRNFTVTLRTAGTQTVTATDLTDGTKTANTSSNLTINPDGGAKLQILVPGESAAPGTATGKTGTPTAQTAGIPFNVTVNAVDVNFNLISGVTDTVAITSSDANAVLPANAALVGGTKTFSVTLKTAGTRTLTATDITDVTKTASTSPGIQVNPGAFTQLQLLVPGESAAPGAATGKTGTPTAQTTGSAFNVTVNAVDSSFNLVNTVTDTVGITSSDGAATLPTNAALVGGTKIFSVTLNTAGSRTVTATDVTDGTKTASTSPSITVNAPTGPTKLVFTTSPQTLLGGQTSGTITVQAQNASSNPVNVSSNVTVNLSTTSAAAFFRDTTDTATLGPPATVTITSGTNSASFKYRDTIVGSPVITAAASGLTSAQQTESVTTICGDVNGDVLANSTDALLIRQLVVGLRTSSDPVFTSLNSGDVNNDGSVNSTDALLIRQLAVGLRSSLPCNAPTVPASQLRAVTPAAGSATLSLDVSALGSAKIRVGDEFTVPVVIDSGTQPLGAYTLRLIFDPRQLNVAGISGGTAIGFSESPLTNPAGFTTGDLLFDGGNAMSLTAPTGKSIVAMLHFKATGKGTAALSLGAVTLSTTNGDRLASLTDSAAIRVRKAKRR